MVNIINYKFKSHIKPRNIELDYEPLWQSIGMWHVSVDGVKISDFFIDDVVLMSDITYKLIYIERFITDLKKLKIKLTTAEIDIIRDNIKAIVI